MSTNAHIAILNQNGTVNETYVHWDGYLSYVGKILNESYRDYDKIQEMMALGEFSSLGLSLEARPLTKRYGFGGSFRSDFLALPKEEQDKLTNENYSGKYSLVYHRDRGEELQKIAYDSEREFLNQWDNKGFFEFLYFYKKGNWYVKTNPRGKFELLSKKLEEISD